jgi:hypothetical protein
MRETVGGSGVDAHIWTNRKFGGFTHHSFLGALGAGLPLRSISSPTLYAMQMYIPSLA